MDSGSLRLWILVVGLGVIAGVFGWAKLQERRSRRKTRIEPEVGHFGTVVQEDEWEVIPVLKERRDAPAREQTAPVALEEEPGLAVETHRPTPSASPRRPVERKPVERPAPAPKASPAAAKELILTLSVLAPRSHEFRGPALAKALREAGLVYGDMKIFHAPADLERPDGPALFSLANVLEPGTLEPERLKLLETPGVVLFAQLPGPVNGLEVFEHMQATGRFLARELGGELCDERRQPLSAEKAEEIRARVLADIGDTVRKPDF